MNGRDNLSDEEVARNVAHTLDKIERRKAWHYEKRNTSKKFRAKRHKVWRDTEGHCVYCNEVIEEKERTLDHITPRNRGGTWCRENLLPACADCNVRRSSSFPPSKLAHPQWMEYVLRRERAIGIHVILSSTHHEDHSPQAQ